MRVGERKTQPWPYYIPVKKRGINGQIEEREREMTNIHLERKKMRNYTIIGAKAKTEKDRRKKREREKSEKTQDARRERERDFHVRYIFLYEE